MASEEAVPSDEEEFHSAAEDGDEVEGKTEQTAVCEDEEGRTFMRAGLESLDLGAMEADMADNDRVSSNSTTADGEQAKRDSEAEGDAKMSGLDNRYVSEEHAPEKDGAVELTEEQIKVIETVTEGAGWSPTILVPSLPNLFNAHKKEGIRNVVSRVRSRDRGDWGRG